MKHIIGSVLLSGALILTATTPLVAHAADTTAAANTTGSTKVTATFTANTGTVDPVDPNNPNVPDPGNTDNGAKPGGGLSLIYVTDQLDFGTHQIDVLNPNTYAANYVDSTTSTNSANVSHLWNSKAVIQVSDVRGTNAGWHLTVQGAQLTGADGTALTGATLALKDGSLTNSGTTSNGVVSSDVANAINDSSNLILNAPVNDGAGVTVDQIDPSNITLTVPANVAKAQAYSTTLNWTLADTPS